MYFICVDVISGNCFYVIYVEIGIILTVYGSYCVVDLYGAY